ncbi:glutamine synthetase family protein [Desulforamulus aquiferis]|uniref:Glutamine synthetase family protein n=2 Tax=Desulforamulus aquiferis TaxID=1397668 RepID=A0AAW7Z894_9FIRM|nr:glutamine synthetase family protein [Desulforamulus aquiferis]
MKSIETTLREMENKDIAFTRLLYIDNDGVIRGQAAVGDQIEGVFKTGHSYALAMPFFGVLDTIGPETNFGCAGEVSAVPDLNTFRILPYVPNTASVICDFLSKDTHQDTGLCPRTMLKKLLSKIDYQVNVAFENEFYLLKRDEQGRLVPFDNSLCFTTSGMNQGHQVISDIIKALQAQQLTVEKYLAEYGPGQHEIAVKYSDALRACDNQVIFRETVRGVSQNYGLVGSFMPKIFSDKAGSGAHIHFSFWSEGKNVFYDPKDENQLSLTARYFIGGIIKHLPALCAFTAPTVTSYKRLVPHNWASAYGCYGFANREAALRVIPGSRGKEEKSFNIEFKPVDGTCNPYLALTAILAAGMDGIEKEIDPGKAIDFDPANLSDQERQDLGIFRFPTNLGEAVIALQEDQFFREVLGDVMYDEYIKLKRFTWMEYNKQITPWELEKYAESF